MSISANEGRLQEFGSRRPGRLGSTIEDLEARLPLTGAGDLDPAFGDGQGYALTAIIPGELDHLSDYITAVVEPDESILVDGPIGVDDRTFGVTHLQPNGTIDGSFGEAGYDGSSQTELAVYLPTLGVLMYQAADGGAAVIPFGVAGKGQTLPAPGDYDGSGRTELAAYVPAYGLFAYRPADGSADVDDFIGVPGLDQTIPVTTVAQATFPGTNPGMGEAIEAPGVLGEPDALDFVVQPESSAKKAKAVSDSTAG